MGSGLLCGILPACTNFPDALQGICGVMLLGKVLTYIKYAPALPSSHALHLPCIPSGNRSLSLIPVSLGGNQWSTFAAPSEKWDGRTTPVVCPQIGKSHTMSRVRSPSGGQRGASYLHPDNAFFIRQGFFLLRILQEDSGTRLINSKVLFISTQRNQAGVGLFTPAFHRQHLFPEFQKSFPFITTPIQQNPGKVDANQTQRQSLL